MIDYVIFISIAGIILYYILKKRRNSDKQKEKVEQLQPEKNNSHTDDISKNAPVIKVVFSSESIDNDEFAKEFADIYISDRSFFYTGKKSTRPDREDTLIEDQVFVEFDKVNFETLKVINV